MDKIGPMSRSALDNGIVLSVIQGLDPRDKSTFAAALNYDAKKSVKSLKIGYFAPYFEGNRPNQENDRRVLEELRGMGFELHPVELKTSVPVQSLLISL